MPLPICAESAADKPQSINLAFYLQRRERPILELCPPRWENAGSSRPMTKLHPSRTRLSPPRETHQPQTLYRRHNPTHDVTTCFRGTSWPHRSTRWIRSPRRRDRSSRKMSPTCRLSFQRSLLRRTCWISCCRQVTRRCRCRRSIHCSRPFSHCCLWCNRSVGCCVFFNGVNKYPCFDLLPKNATTYKLPSEQFLNHTQAVLWISIYYRCEHAVLCELQKWS